MRNKQLTGMFENTKIIVAMSYLQLNSIRLYFLCICIFHTKLFKFCGDTKVDNVVILIQLYIVTIKVTKRNKSYFIIYNVI